MTWKQWFHSLIAAVVGGAANTLSAVLVAPDQFNFSHAGMIKLAEMAGAGALISLVMFLKQSPVPGDSNPGPQK